MATVPVCTVRTSQCFPSVSVGGGKGGHVKWPVLLGRSWGSASLGLSLGGRWSRLGGARPAESGCLPGLSDIPGEAMVKLYCPKCMDVYTPKSSRHHHTDGAYFGTGFPHMLFMVHPEYRPKRPANQFVPRWGTGIESPRVKGKVRDSPERRKDRAWSFLEVCFSQSK